LENLVNHRLDQVWIDLRFKVPVSLQRSL